MKRHRSVASALLALGTAAALAGCGTHATRPGVVEPQADGALTAAPDGANPGASRALPPFDPDHFVDQVTNPYFPLVPGTVWRYESRTDEGLETIVVEVLHQPKTILGIRATVVRDRVSLDGELIEDTFDWYAQDAAGNVWYLGEDTKEYEDGQVVSTAGSWEAGVNGAEAGILMLADPEPGDRYAQEYAPGEAEDQARVRSDDETVTVPWGTFTDVVQTLEWTPLEPGAREYKYYAPGVGPVLESSTNGRDRVELVSVTTP